MDIKEVLISKIGKIREALKGTLVLILLAICLVLWFSASSANAETVDLANQLKRKNETLAQMELELGVYQSQQTVVDDMKDLVLDRFDAVLKGHDALRREIKRGNIQRATEVTVAPKSEGVFSHESTKEDALTRSFDAGDRFTRFGFQSDGTIVYIDHAPIQLSIIDKEENGVRKQFAVVVNGWDKLPVNEVEIASFIPEETVWKPYFAAELFVGTHYADLRVRRQANRWFAYGAGMGYVYDQSELSFGAMISLNLFFRPR